MNKKNENSNEAILNEVRAIFEQLNKKKENSNEVILNELGAIFEQLEELKRIDKRIRKEEKQIMVNLQIFIKTITKLNS